MKKILLIEDVKQFSLDMLRTVGDMKLIEEYIEKHSPGSLVAEFEGRIIHYSKMVAPPGNLKETKQIQLPDEIASQFQVGHKFRILILSDGA